MLKIIDNIEDISKKVIVIAGDTALIFLLCCCLLQVFTRYILNSSLTWTEEMARFSFMYVSFLGSALCVKNGMHARITVLTDFVPKPVQKVLEYVGNVIIIICAFVMITQGFSLLSAVSVQKSPMLKIPMSVFYAACPIGAIFMGLYALLKMLRDVAVLMEGKKVGDQ